MVMLPAEVIVSLRSDEGGVIRIGDTRITLQTVIAAYRRGDSPEDILDGFPSLKLADIYAIIAYYLSHRDEVEAYLNQQAAMSENVLRQIQQTQPEMLQAQQKFRLLLEEKKRNLS